MAELVIESNKVVMKGEIISGFAFSHEIYGEKFYLVDMEIKRLSEHSDVVPVMVSERLINVNDDYTGTRAKVLGQYRSYNSREEGKTRLQLTVFAREIENLEDGECDDNQIELIGHICKEPKFRVTPKGREVCDILLAVNRPYGKSDYIPTICWGRNAKFASTLGVGTEIIVKGRLQSRNYTKINDGNEEQHIAYEVSISKIEVA